MERSYPLPWHYIAGALMMVLPHISNSLNYGNDDQRAPSPQFAQPITRQDRREWTAEVCFDERAVTFTVQGNDASATVQVKGPPELNDFTIRVLSALDNFAFSVRQTHRQEHRISPEGAIELYYRAKSRK
jgi:hypothetical protein